MTTVPFALSDGLAGSGHRNEVIPASASRFAEFDFVGIPPEVSVQGEWDKVLVNVCWVDLGSGVPPGAVSRAGASGPAQRAAIGGGKNHQRLILGNRTPTRLRDISQPINLAPRTLACLRFNQEIQAVDFSL